MIDLSNFAIHIVSMVLQVAKSDKSNKPIELSFMARFISCPRLNISKNFVLKVFVFDQTWFLILNHL